MTIFSVLIGVKDRIFALLIVDHKIQLLSPRRTFCFFISRAPARVNFLAVSGVARGGRGNVPPPSNRERKAKNALKCTKMHQISKIFRLQRLSAPQAPFFFTYKG